MSHVKTYLDQICEIAKKIDQNEVEKLVADLVSVRQGRGRLFVLGVGGSAANAAHAVNDFRKLCGIETYAPTDNVSELTARTNDEGWETVFEEWLKISRVNDKDAVLVFSVGGGNLENNVSVNLINALKLCKERKTRVLGIVGRDGGYTKQVGDTVVVIPPVNPDTVTPHAEAYQGVIWHCLVSHPDLQVQATKW